jgi:hypothetical protein
MSDELPDNPEPPKDEFLADISSDRGSVVSGLGQTLLLHLLQIPMAALTGFATLIVIGLSQCIYMIPAIIYSNKRGEYETMKGLIIGASVTFLLNAACTGIVFMSLS